MTGFFLVCAVLGGTILICQFVLTLVGLGHADVDLDAGHSLDVSHDGVHDAHHPEGHAHSSSWLFGVLSFRTLTAATTFFGLAGYAASSAGVETPSQLGIALACGVAALYGVHWLMRSLVSLTEDGSVRIERAIGLPATVYLTVPGKRSGSGKVQFKLQNRLVEYEAVTDCEDALHTGAKVRILGVNGSTVIVGNERNNQ